VSDLLSIRDEPLGLCADFPAPRGKQALLRAYVVGPKSVPHPRQAAELEHGRAQASLDAGQRLRAQLEKDLAATQKRPGGR
jgi:hypothetical protein